MLMRTDPFRDLDRLTQQVLGTAVRPAAMPMDAYRQGDSFYVHFDLPGIDASSISLTVEQNVLTVRAERAPVKAGGAEMIVAERPYGTFTRQVFLGETLDADKIAADYAAGVRLLPDIQDERGGVIAGERVHDVNGPARRSRAGLVFKVSRGSQSVAVTSAMAARAEAWSTRFFPARRCDQGGGADVVDRPGLAAGGVVDLGDRVVGEQFGGPPGLLQVVADRGLAVSSGVMPFIWYLTAICCSRAASTPSFTECRRVGWPTRMVVNGVEESMS